MENNYNYTTNNYYTMNNSSSSTVINFDSPRWVMIEGQLHQVYGMLLITKLEAGSDNKEDSIKTYRRFLIGENRRPSDVLDENDDNLFMFLPENGIINENDLKKIIEKSSPYQTTISVIDDLKESNVKFQSKNKVLEVFLNYYAKNSILFITSDAFHFELDKVSPDKIKDLSPADFVDVIEIYGYTGIDFTFANSDEENKDVDALANTLGRWMELYKKGELLHDENNLYVCNDGEYTYSEFLGRVRMTNEEFIRRFPDARKF